MLQDYKCLEALEQQLKILTDWETGQFDFFLDVLWERGATNMKPDARPAKNGVGKMQSLCLKNAKSFFVDAHIVRTLSESLNSLPDLPLSYVYNELESPNDCWVYLEEPLLLKDGCALRAWTSQQLYTKPPDGPEFPTLNAMFYKDSTVPTLIPHSFVDWDLGSNWGKDWKRTDCDSSDDLDESLELCRRFVFAFLLFISQPIVKVTDAPLPRPFRRRLERKAQQLPVIKIIQLRRIERDYQAGNGHKVDWSCQWLVRGHWRKQWYPKADIHKPLFVSAYVKGPPDKPLRQARWDIWLVNR